MLHVKRFIGSYKLRFLYLVFSSVNYEDLPETAIKKLPKRPRLRFYLTDQTEKNCINRWNLIIPNLRQILNYDGYKIFVFV